ncbi:MAG: response regulator transcription factor [Chloroflexi bacterium]|nr:response regulator transcription factor [Chloroflexota bacterium]
MTHSKTDESRIRVILVDDHIQVHKVVEILLRSTPDIELVATGANGREALCLCEQFQPDIVLMDVMMPVMDGIKATKELFERFPEIKVLVLSSFHDHESVYAMLRNGAVGYLTKSSLSKDLAATIRDTFHGKMVFSSEVGVHLVTPPQPAVNFHLTDRELQVLVLMAEGLNMPEIAAKLIVSPTTVKFHMENICKKLGIRTRSEALVIAAKNNLV